MQFIALLLSFVVSSVALADPGAIAAAVDFATVVTAVGVVGLALAGVLVAIKGAKIVLRFLGR